ncbi:uncharacterized protein LOC128214148 isoform X2 [Mya arenaria]|uniref:uncharacterized protein LOC128214148 isoform X2 n=1 Tax=Mya arenaria TaxID=6604 RepID=UPI0022E4D7D6|nr:uncharacterized protein LOC128214148 isoform X2 [Mya arenaria]
MDDDAIWSTYTHRLDELERRVEFPCVVRLNEGYYSEAEGEGFSHGDIVAIDKKLVLHKVAANFANRIYRPSHSPAEEEWGYERLTDEILVPLNYNGKAKIQSTGKKYSTVRDLVADFPRYAKVCKNLKVWTADRQPVELQAGAVIELDRVMPASSAGAPDNLVLIFDYQTRSTYATVPMDAKASFRTEPDETEYTIKEVIDRFKMPQVVKFVDDQIRKIYTQDLVEGIENMHTITEMLQLNRLVTQNVLVGHYKPVGDVESGDSKHFKRRTLIVLPLDHPEIREVEVNVLEGQADLYEEVVSVQNISSDMDVVDSLYVEFRTEFPALRRFTFTEEDDASVSEQDQGTNHVTAENHPQQNEPDDDTPPPVPARRGRAKANGGVTTAQVRAAIDPTKLLPNSATNPKTSPPIKGRKNPAVSPKVVPMGSGSPSTLRRPLPMTPKGTDSFQTKQEKDLEDGYEQMGKAPPPPSRKPKTQKDKDGYEIPVYAPHVALPIPKRAAKKGIFSKLHKGHKHKHVYENEEKHDTVDTTKAIDDELLVYDVVDEATLGRFRDPGFAASQQVNKVRPIAAVQPQNSNPMSPTHSDHKSFVDLSCSEVVSRLKKCKLNTLAVICEKDKLDGSFFKFISDTELAKDLKLGKLDVLKLKKMRDENWVLLE